jgi:transcriptional antiterminator RfaH
MAEQVVSLAGSCAADTRQWYAIRSKPKRESFAAGLLAKAGIEVYLPQVRVHKQHGKPAVLEPFFPSYFFGHLDSSHAELHIAKYTPGVLCVVGYGDEPWPVPDELIHSIQQRLTRGRGQAAQSAFRPGDRVVVTSGPLRGVEAIFDRNLSPTGRVRVLIQILRRLCPAEVRVGELRKIS